MRFRPGPLIAVLALALLSACASNQHASRNAADYAAHAPRSYAPPGPAHDPWGPYITEASKRFDVPERWIREVIRQESGGRTHMNGAPITSSAGAMGLMQVMPGTYEELRAKHGLGPDPYHPYDSIMAGTAYIREMYDLYGSPGFLAAYNAGPRRLEDYLYRNRGLPSETRRYVASIGPYITDSHPERRAPAEVYAAAAIPLNIPSGRRGATQYARAGARTPQPARSAVQVAQLPSPSRPSSRAVQTAALPTPAPSQGGFRLIPQAQASTLPRAPVASGGGWAVQVGAFASESQARGAVGRAKTQARELGTARTAVTSVRQARGTLYRARVIGLSRDSAVSACERISRARGSCMVLSPDAQG